MIAFRLSSSRNWYARDIRVGWGRWGCIAIHLHPVYKRMEQKGTPYKEYIICCNETQFQNCHAMLTWLKKKSTSPQPQLYPSTAIFLQRKSKDHVLIESDASDYLKKRMSPSFQQMHQASSDYRRRLRPASTRPISCQYVHITYIYCEKFTPSGVTLMRVGKFVTENGSCLKGLSAFRHLSTFVSVVFPPSSSFSRWFPRSRSQVFMPPSHEQIREETYSAGCPA